MKNIYKSALGKAIDIDAIRLANEEVLAVGNMRVNARGDEIGPGGRVIKTRNEIMHEYYQTQRPEPSPLKVDESKLQEQLVKHEKQQQTLSKVRGSMAKKILEDQDGVE